jgi:hypothetical protein
MSILAKPAALIFAGSGATGLRDRSQITSCFDAPIHPAWLRCWSVKQACHSPYSRFATRAPRHLEMQIYF